MEAIKVVVACGGTGGHIFPGLTVANELRKSGHEVEVWLSGRNIEEIARKGWDGTIFATGMRQISFKGAPYALRALYLSLKRLRELRPHLVLAMGSYSSLPPVLAAKLLRIPIVLHEANAVPGKAVDFLSRYAATTAVSFEETIKWLPGRKLHVTGVPLRGDLVGQPRFAESAPETFTLLVTGGSQGAHSVNELVAQALVLLKRDGTNNFFVIHQSGAADEAAIKECYAQAGINAMVSAFIPEMGRAYASADFVICRAGASTCFELCLLGKPALLVPLPNAKRDHQRLNAEAIARGGGVDVAIQHELSPRALARYIKNKMEHPAQLERMSQALTNMARPEAGRLLAEVINAVARDTKI